MKTKHNKKRNTAFIFEALIREMSKAIIDKDSSTKNKIVTLLREHFRQGAVLERELQCYRALTEKSGFDNYTAEKTIHRAKDAYNSLDKQKIFEEQSVVIGKINKDISSSVFSNFVPNYRSFATIAQIFSSTTPVKQKVIMEQRVLEVLTSSSDPKGDQLVPTDNLVVVNFIEKFNDQYDTLLSEQKNLLNKYIFSFNNDDADFKVTMFEELKRIKTAVLDSLKSEEVSSDETMVSNSRKIIEQIESINVSNIGDKELKTVLKLQNLVNEYKSDAINN
tara:strand:+ start:4528 stop:5361 length:834 start_codon:yes stop_codon:yes gene_type:complete